MRARGWLLPAGVLVAALFASGPQGAAATDSQLSAAIDHAVEFRSGFWLRSDPAFVASTFNESDFDDSEYGVPLSKAELADLAHGQKFGRHSNCFSKRRSRHQATPAPSSIILAAGCRCS
jgi:hypothetical protein